MKWLGCVFYFSAMKIARAKYLTQKEKACPIK